MIERELDAIPAAARSFAESQSEEELWVAVARFAVLAYAPSQHAKRAVMAVWAAHAVRDFAGDRWVDWIVECARYSAESRPPWSEPPILDDLAVDESRLTEIRDGDALLMLDTARALEPLLGEKGRAALLRMPLEELGVGGEEVNGTLESLVDQAIASQGAVDDVRAVFVAIAKRELHPSHESHQSHSSHGTYGTLLPYHLARDYAQTLIAHAYGRRLDYRTDEFLAAVHYNLEHGDNYAEWSFA
ncbi:MAG TPA: hypothetical protein VEK57_25745 [Thermoanaerobaculia bacterium]|nr:hypothetical protein [Thermoanaerobaculia bacterium]